MESFEFFDLLLEDADVIHECDDSVSSHGTGVEPGCSQQWSHVKRHGALRCVEDEQLAPTQPQQPDLVRHL